MESAIRRHALRAALATSSLLAALAAGVAMAQQTDTAADSSAQRFALHGQATIVEQGNDSFTAPYEGENSLISGARGRESINATLFVGVRPWRGAELWLGPQVDQGRALSEARGVAGIPDGEAPRGGTSQPYVRLQDAFLRQTFNLGGATTSAEPGEIALRQPLSANRVVITVGKFSVIDVFDINRYAHDSRDDFLNGAIIDAGSFDYASDIRGYTYGAAGEVYRGPWTVRLGVFAMSTAPESQHLDTGFGQFQVIVEGERRYALFNRPGSIKVTAFDSRARMGSFADALKQGAATDETPEVFDVRRQASRLGVSVNVEQSLGSDLGVFFRAGDADGGRQSYEITDIDRTVSGGVQLTGARWGRGEDVVSLGAAINDISGAFKTYLNAGGLGLLIGDGKLPHPGSEDILETFYKVSVIETLTATLDYQLVVNPGYNRDRGPVSLFALRLHAAF